MSDIFLSVRGRVLLNVEALNMTESVGNYVKHRRVPVILPGSSYTTYFVPAISGESIAHGFQEVLAQVARKNKLPVCRLCERGIFLKSTNNSVIYESFRGIIDNINKGMIQSESDFEKFILKNCVVEDLGGFLYAPGRQEKLNNEAKEKLATIGIMEKRENRYSNIFGNIKRTSNFYTGYMIPVREALEGVVIEPQLHSRYALGTPFVERGQQGQMIYYVELSSAVYTFSFDLDTRYVGKVTFSYEDAGDEAVNDRIERIESTLDAVKNFLIEFMFGAKKTRFLPVLEWESLMIAISDDVWTVPCPSIKEYIENAEKKKGKVDYNTELFVYPRDGNFEQVIVNATEKAKEKLGKNK